MCIFQYITTGIIVRFFSGRSIMHKAVKYVIVAIVLVAGLYCMKVSPMDGALVCAGVIAAYVLLDRLVLEDKDCSCEYSPEHGIHEDFEATPVSSSAPLPTSATASPPPTAPLPGSLGVFSGSGNRYNIGANGVASLTPPSKYVSIPAPSAPVFASQVSNTTGTDSFGKQSMGDLRYSQTNVNTMANTADRIAQKPRAVYGEVFVDPEAWHPPCLRPGVCVTSNGCPVQGVFTNGTYIDLLEWDDSRRITPPDAIDSSYINNVLNSGTGL
jgi:hypothetical protein